MADEPTQNPDLDAEWEALARFLAGESAPDEEQRLRGVLAADPDRAALLAALDAALTIPSQAPLASAEVEAALVAVRARRGPELANEGSPGSAPLRERPSVQLARLRWQWRHAGLRAAAAVLVVAGASMLWRVVRHPEPAVTAVASAPKQYTTPKLHVDSIQLADGTQVVLGPGSSLTVASGFGSGTREVTLDGDGYFDVVHNETVPFVVRTAHATLRDVGTTFTVHSDRDRGTRVAVTAGAVDLVAALSPAGPRAVLRAGDRAVVIGTNVQIERGVVSGDELAWTRGVLVFRDAPIDEVAAGLRRWFGYELIVTDSTIATRRLTANFERGSANDVGRVLGAALGGSVVRSHDTLRLGSTRNTR
jgi:transmembrane sensor